MNFIKDLDGGFSVIENLKVSGAREGKFGVSIIVSPNSTASAVFTSNKVVAAPVKYTKNILKKGIISAVFYVVFFAVIAQVSAGNVSFYFKVLRYSTFWGIISLRL